jgi:outer membrane protein OmpA-like peptidoglycan-associated protein
MQLRTLFALIAALVGAAALASPNSSQHPRVGYLAELRFDSGSSALRDRDERAKLDLGRVAAWANENPDALLVLDGHADKSGPAPTNVRLSLARAQAVRDELVGLGVDPHQLVIAAFGERGPRARGNRRVVIWGTRAGMTTVAARSVARNRAAFFTGSTTSAPTATSAAQRKE